MDRVTRHLVFQLPQTSHKHSHSDAHQAGSFAEQRADSDDDVFDSAQQSSQGVENGYDGKTRSKSSSCFLDCRRDVWTPPLDRESKLEVVRSGNLYDLRAYGSERKPSKLYDEDEQEEDRVPPPNISPEKARELEDERREIIRSQVVRKSSTMAKRWSSMDELSTSFDASLGKAAMPVDSDNIDTEQINFSAARQQFLILEKTSPSSFFSLGQQAMSPKPESMTKVSRQEWHSPEMATKPSGGYGNAGTSSQSWRDKTIYQAYSVSYKTPVKEEVYDPRRADTERSYPTGRTPSLTKASSREDVDSGLGEMYSKANAGYTSDGSTSNEIFNGLVDLKADSNGLDTETKVSNETPIEREIRMAMEREENLWKERGIQRLTSSSDPGRKRKNKGRASLYVQREIEQETKREEDLKKEGRLLGTYDRGTQQELDERRRVFEQEEAPPQKPTPTRRADERRSWVNERQSSEDSWDGRLPSSTPSPTGRAVLPREYFFFSFWKPKVSFVDDMGTQNPLRREDGRQEQYKLRTWKPQTLALIEEEIRSDLQREEELQEQRQLIDG
ncbi:Mitotic interactor and substrate of PLK1, partial [Phalacrocorax carbo]